MTMTTPEANEKYGHLGDDLVHRTKREHLEREARSTSTAIDQAFTPAIVWTKPLTPVGPDEDPDMKLLGRLEILGAEFQAEAYEVEDQVEGENTAQVGKQDYDETYLFETLEIVQSAAQTITIKGRDYVLLITPCQR